MRKIQPAIRAYLQYTLHVPPGRRGSALMEVFLPDRQRFLEKIEGAVSIDLLSREEDIQVLAGFDTLEHARAYQDGPAGREIAAHLARVGDREPDTACYVVD